MAVMDITGNRLYWQQDTEKILIEPWGKDGLRVRVTRNGSFDAPGAVLRKEGFLMPKKQAVISLCLLLAAAAALFLLLRPGDAPSVGGTPVGTATLTVSCENLLGDDRASAELRAAVPDDGLLVPPTEVTVLEGDTAFTLLERVCAERGVALDVQRGLSGVYVQGIGGVREFDCGALSGWLFRINGEIRSTDSGSVVLQDGDVLEFLYTCELGADIR